MVRTGKAKQANRFSFLTTQLTRWRSAVRARTGLPLGSNYAHEPMSVDYSLGAGLEQPTGRSIHLSATLATT